MTKVLIGNHMGMTKMALVFIFNSTSLK